MKTFLYGTQQRDSSARYQIPTLRQEQKIFVRISQESGRYGFGYVSAVDDYKLVLVIPEGESGAAENVFKDLDVNIFIFSVRANTWSTRKGPRWSFPPRGWRKHCGVLSNKAIHWCIDCSEHDVDGNVIEACYIYAFDLASEELRRMPIPAGLLLDAEESYHMIGRIMQTVFHLGGYLCLLSQSWQLDEERDEIALRIMREYGVSDSWMNLMASLHSLNRIHALDGLVMRVLSQKVVQLWSMYLGSWSELKAVLVRSRSAASLVDL